MPDKDGYEVLKVLRSDPTLVSTPVVVVSVSDEAARVLGAGAQCYLAKPVDAEDLVATVRNLLASEIRNALVVDDDPDTVRLLTNALVEHGIEVRAASNGLEALAELVESVPSVILLDLTMPVMDGFELLEHLQSDPAWNEIPVVILTGKTLALEEAAKLGNVSRAILTKGRIDTENLVDLVLKAALCDAAPKKGVLA
jgi:CheY-like chemotaxis protein